MKRHKESIIWDRIAPSFEFGLTLGINKIVPAFPVSDKKARALRSRLDALQCFERDLEESFLGGSGVALRHRPTGIRVRCCRKSSQALNRFLARRLLADELEAQLQNKTRYQVKAEKLREAKGKRNAPACIDHQSLAAAMRLRRTALLDHRTFERLRLL
jgi:peptide chain release factor